MAGISNDKLRALDSAMRQIEKDFGKGSIMRLGEASAKMNVETIPTGALSLDIALGVGGIPRGRVVEIYGPESSGKTTVALHMIAEAQKMGGYAAFIDAEHALDPDYARRLGVDVDNLLISQPDNGEQALEICDALVRSGAIDIIVIDSVAALVPRAEIEGEMGDSHVGLQARLMSQALRKLTGIISKSKCATIFINQIREKVGNMLSVPAPVLRWSKTQWLRLLNRQSSTSCTDREFPVPAAWWTWAWIWISCKRAAPGSHTETCVSARVGKKLRIFCGITRKWRRKWKQRSANSLLIN